MSSSDGLPDRPASQNDSSGDTSTSAEIATSGAPVAVGDDLAATIRRAQRLGIPAWRVLTALGVALPVTGR